jgi:phage tail-like protein
MVQRDPNLPFNRWIRDTLTNPTGKVTREVHIVAMDEGRESRRWVLRRAWISEISYSDFDSGSDQLVEERLTLQHDGITMLWPGE